MIDPAGTYDATWVCLGGNFSGATNYGNISEVVTIVKQEGNDDKYNVTNMFTAPNMGVTSTSYLATFSGNILTVHLTTGDIELGVTENKLTYTHEGAGNYPKVHDWNFYKNSYSAVKR